MSDFTTGMYDGLDVPAEVIRIASCIPGGGSAADKLGLASELYNAYGVNEIVPMEAGKTYDFTTTPNRQGTIAVAGGAGATWELFYEINGVWELYDNQPVPIDGDAWDIVIVYCTYNARLVQTGGAASEVLINR